MCVIETAKDRIKELEQELREKDIAMMGMSAKLNGLSQMSSVHQREKSQLWDQAQTLQVIAIKLGLKPGSAAVGTVPAAVVDLIAERDKLLDGYPEGMTPTDVEKLKEANAGMAAQLHAIESMPEERRPEPADSYESLLKQFNSLWILASSRWKQVKLYQDRDYQATREAALAGSAEINGLRDANRQLTDQLMTTEAKLDSIAEHAAHAARCQLINEITDRWNSDDQVAVEQIIDLLCAERESSDAA